MAYLSNRLVPLMLSSDTNINSLFSFIVQLLNVRQEFDVIVVLVHPFFSYYINDSGQLLSYFMTV